MPKLPSQSVIYLMLCGGMLLAFVLLVIFPYKQALEKADSKRVAIKAQIEEQKILHPIFKRFIKQIEAAGPEKKTQPRLQKINRTETARLASRFQELARESRLQLKSVTPDINSFVDESGALKVDVHVAGAFLDLRQFFLKLAEIPFLEHIESIHIESVSKLKDATLILWMAKDAS